jgi:hypothetical protein
MLDAGLKPLSAGIFALIIVSTADVFCNSGCSLLKTDLPSQFKPLMVRADYYSGVRDIL